MMKRHMTMMQGSGVTPQMMQRCLIMMQTPIFTDSPSALLDQEKALELSDDQKKKLTEIETDARLKALALLTPQQRKKLGDLPSQPMAMSQMCQQMASKMCPMMRGGSSPSGSGSKPE